MVTVERREKRHQVFLVKGAILGTLLCPHIAGSGGWTFSGQSFNLSSRRNNWGVLVGLDIMEKKIEGN